MMLVDKQELHDAAGETHTEGSNQGQAVLLCPPGCDVWM